MFPQQHLPGHHTLNAVVQASYAISSSSARYFFVSSTSDSTGTCLLPYFCLVSLPLPVISIQCRARMSGSHPHSLFLSSISSQLALFCRTYCAISSLMVLVSSGPGSSAVRYTCRNAASRPRSFLRRYALPRASEYCHDLHTGNSAYRPQLGETQLVVGIIDNDYPVLALFAKYSILPLDLALRRPVYMCSSGILSA